MDYLQNLTILREAISNAPPERIDLWDWNGGCGTVYCAAGVAATLPFFQNLGLKTRTDGSPYMYGPTDGDTSADRALNALFLPFPVSIDADSTVAYDYIFTSPGQGRWDQKILNNGDLSDQDLALARLDIAIMNWKFAAKNRSN